MQVFGFMTIAHHGRIIRDLGSTGIVPSFGVVGVDHDSMRKLSKQSRGTWARNGALAIVAASNGYWPFSNRFKTRTPLRYALARPVMPATKVNRVHCKWENCKMKTPLFHSSNL
jgi:hypothetical protein